MIKKLVLCFVVAMSVFIGGVAFTPSQAHAAVASGCKNDFLGFPAWYEYLEVGPKTLPNGGTDPCAILGPTTNGDFDLTLALPRIGLAITDILIRVAGMVAVIFVIVGGFKYMTSQGEPEGLKQAQGTIINALIGLAIAVLAVTIVSFLGRTLWS